MKVRDTSPGRLYALSSKTGCTAVNGTMVVAVPSKGQVVVLALDKKIIIDGDDAAKFVEVRWGANAAIGSRPTPSWFSDVLSGIISIVGEDTFDINYIPAENKLFLQFSLDVTNEQIAEVNSFLERVVLPNDLVVEMEWADGLPASYKRLEYLETSIDGRQWIDTGLLFATGNIKMRATSITPHTKCFLTGFATHTYWGENDVDKGKNFTAYQETSGIFTVVVTGISGRYFVNRVPNAANVIIDLENGFVEVNGTRRRCTPFTFEYTALTLPMFAYILWYGKTDIRTYACTIGARIYSFNVEAKANGNVQHGNFIPALNPEGQPGMYDTVNKVFKTNKGMGDFTYPGKETEATTYSLRNRMYGKITEHGIRRLYRVPEGYSSKEEYAAENGYKLIVEPPMPEEGYWNPVWHDREDCIELEWVETEPPTAEEELQIEDTENA